MSDDTSGDAPERNYPVGRGKPPAHTRFTPGRSGNPRGRPKGSKNFATILEEEENQLITVIENGKRIRITKQRAIVRQTVNDAARGNRGDWLKAHARIGRKTNPDTPAPPPATDDLTFGDADDEEVLKQLLADLKKESLS